VGFIHSSQLRFFPVVGPAGFNAAWGPVIGYLAMALLFLVMMWYTRNDPKPQFDDKETS
jgi:hypothetical protein